MLEDEDTLDPELSADPQEGELSAQEKQLLFSKNGLIFGLEQHENKKVEQYINYFSHKAKDSFTRWLKRSEEYLPLVREAMDGNGLPHDLALLPFTESGYNPKAYSRAGAAGMWQFMPSTGRKYGLTVNWWIDERRDPYLSTDAAIRYLKDLYALFDDWYLALAAYNAGEGKIGRAIRALKVNTFFDLAKKNKRLRYRSRLRRETLNYIPKFIAISKIFQNLEALGFEKVNWDSGKKVQHITVPGGTDLLALARAGNMPWADFHALNPAYRRQVSPPNKETTAHVPVDKSEAMLAYLSDPGSRPYAGYTVYVVRQGDSWWSISRKFRVPISVLKKVNNRRSNLLRPGQTVMVPAAGQTRKVAHASTSKTQSIAQSRANYTIQRGDTLWGISQTFGVSVRSLQIANGLQSHSRIKAGQRLYIPKRDEETRHIASKKQSTEAKQAQLVRYKIRKGDSLSTIAERFAVPVHSLRQWNSLGHRSTIYTGRYLNIYVE